MGQNKGHALMFDQDRNNEKRCERNRLYLLNRRCIFLFKVNNMVRNQIMYNQQKQIGAIHIYQWLLHKYDSKFHSHFITPIDHIIYASSHAKISIQYQDTIILTEDQQHLRRMYRIKTPLGRREIQQRLLLLSKFYNDGFIMKFEYPMMVITNNKSIIMRRFRRIRKMNAAEGSSSYERSNSLIEGISHNSDALLANLNADWSTESEYCYFLKQNGKLKSKLEDLGSYQLDSVINNFWSDDVHDVFQNGQPLKKVSIYGKRQKPKSRDINILGNYSEIQAKAELIQKNKNDFDDHDRGIIRINTRSQESIQQHDEDYNFFNSPKVGYQNQLNLDGDEAEQQSSLYLFTNRIKEGLRIRNFQDLPSGLICDFDDIDQDRIEAEYLDMKHRKKLRLTSKATKQSSHNESIQNLIKKFPKTYQNIKKKNLFNTYAGSFSRNNQKLDNQLQNQEKMAQKQQETTTLKNWGYITLPESNYGEKDSQRYEAQQEERRSKKQRIRDKAAELLKKPRASRNGNGYMKQKEKQENLLLTGSPQNKEEKEQIAHSITNS